MPQTQTPPKPIFTWERLLWAIAVAVSLFFGLPVPMMMGCPGPRPNPDPDVIVPPEPVVPTLKKIVLVRESGLQNDALARLVESLNGGKGAKWLEEQGVELIGLIDPGDINSMGEPCKLVKKYKAEFDGQELPLVLLLDDAGGVIGKKTIPEVVNLEAFITICTVSDGEQAFASQPFVDADWADWPEFGKGDNAEVDTFEAVEAEPILKSGEPVLGQVSPRGPPGLIEENPAEGEPIFEDAIPLIPREYWPTAIKAIEDNGGSLDLLVTRIYDQKSEGSCVSNATCQAMEIAQAIRRGKKSVVHLSAISLYKRVGRSPGSGSMVSSNLKEILGIGVLPLTSPENDARFTHTMPNTGFYTKYPTGWQETAKRFRGNEVYDVRSYDGFITALLRGYPVVYGRSGHSICAVRPVYKGNQLYVKYCNSWSQNWGENGYGYDSERMIRSGASWAFALRTVVDPDLTLRDKPGVHVEMTQDYALAP